jgi:predicted regulator of Ras-like GTPase activity (Roadblock/LC7/MglB family)
MESKLKEILSAINTEIAGAIGSSIFEINSGLSLASHSNRVGLDFSIVAAYNAEVVKQKKKALTALNFANEDIDEFMITLTSQIHVIKAINKDTYLYISVDSSISNIGMIKVVLNKHASAFKQIIG